MTAPQRSVSHRCPFDRTEGAGARRTVREAGPYECSTDIDVGTVVPDGPSNLRYPPLSVRSHRGGCWDLADTSERCPYAHHPASIVGADAHIGPSGCVGHPKGGAMWASPPTGAENDWTPPVGCGHDRTTAVRITPLSVRSYHVGCHDIRGPVMTGPYGRGGYRIDHRSSIVNYQFSIINYPFHTA